MGDGRVELHEMEGRWTCWLGNRGDEAGPVSRRGMLEGQMVVDENRMEMEVVKTYFKMKEQHRVR